MLQLEQLHCKNNYIILFIIIINVLADIYQIFFPKKILSLHYFTNTVLNQRYYSVNEEIYCDKKLLATKTCNDCNSDQINHAWLQKSALVKKLYLQ